MELKVFVGVDWGSEEHAVHAVDAAGQELMRRMVAHTAEALEQLTLELTALCAGPDQVGVALERPDGIVVETLQEAGFALFHINPKQLDRFRDRFSVAGCKDDPLDSEVLAKCLRTDMALFHVLPPLPDWMLELRRISRRERALTTEITAVANQLHAVLSRSFPQMLEAVPSLTKTNWVLRLIELIPSPEAASRVTVEAVAKAIRGCRKLKPADVLNKLRSGVFLVSPGIAQASEFEARQLVGMLQLLMSQRADCRRRMKKLLAGVQSGAVEGDPDGRWACDFAVLRSLPGIGDKSLAELTAEAPQPLRDRDYQRLRALTGVAPVTKKTGKRGKERPQVLMRKACNKRLRNTVNHIAKNAVRVDPKFRDLYARARARGHGHARALRTVGDRLLAVLCACLRDGALYRRPNVDARHAA